MLLFIYFDTSLLKRNGKASNIKLTVKNIIDYQYLIFAFRKILCYGTMFTNIKRKNIFKNFTYFFR